MSDPAPDLGQLLVQGHEMILESIRVHHERWGLGDETRWTLDQREGLVRWDLGERTATAPAQVLGSWSPDSGTFVWSWDNETILAPLRRTAEQVRAWGVEHEVFALSASPLRLEEQQAMDLVALAFRVGGCRGLVPPARGALASYVVFGEVTITEADGSTDTFEVSQP
ncbi:DUF6882 domain-containing protein [Nocardioides aequoreus]|uniref:DUF6882 domain-containing protein n=1 Tax=Nocardioides aequoreus TaxID=397278 RepID=UPI00068F881F|nr:DUF6882 domain-containing protein [Nocardioides aequoreus]